MASDTSRLLSVGSPVSPMDGRISLAFGPTVALAHIITAAELRLLMRLSLRKNAIAAIWSVSFIKQKKRASELSIYLGARV